MQKIIQQSSHAADYEASYFILFFYAKTIVIYE